VQVLFASGSLDDHNAAFLKSDLLEVICWVVQSSLGNKPDIRGFELCIYKIVEVIN
jgi:hypothetical protein